MGELITATIYVDTSFNNGICQAGYYIYFNFGNEPYVNCTEVFEAPDNNSAELYGIQKACEVTMNMYKSVYNYDEEPEYHFKVFNDNITAVTVSDSGYKPSKKANGRFKHTKWIKAWCEENNITLKCVRKKRSHVIMKKCDKLSKSYRKEGKWKHMK